MFSALTSKIFGSVALALMMIVVLQSCDIDRLTGQRDTARQLAKDEAAAHQGTIDNYSEAAEEAARAQQANLDRVAAERDALNRSVIDDLQAARATADARYRSLLATAAEANSRSAGDPDLSGIAEATCRAYAAAGCDEIPALLKAAQDNTDLLLRWQEWGRSQQAIDTSPQRVFTAPEASLHPA